jgi:hypothetical protein
MPCADVLGPLRAPKKTCSNSSSSIQIVTAVTNQTPTQEAAPLFCVQVRDWYVESFNELRSFPRIQVNTQLRSRTCSTGQTGRGCFSPVGTELGSICSTLRPRKEGVRPLEGSEAVEEGQQHQALLQPHA